METHLGIFVNAGGKGASHLRLVLKQASFNGLTTEILVSLGQVFQSDKSRWACSNDGNLHIWTSSFTVLKGPLASLVLLTSREYEQYPMGEAGG